MNFYRLIILLFVIVCPAIVGAQTVSADYTKSSKGVNDTLQIAGTVDNGALIPWIAIREVDIVSARSWRSNAERDAYMRLRYNVLKVMPYALFAKRRYEQLERDLAGVVEKNEQKKLVKTCDREIKDLFNREIKELTITQGQILTKLVDRELGKTTYDIVRETKGGFTAFLYQSVARVIGHNLKTTYNPREERDIESIISNAGFYSGNRN